LIPLTGARSFTACGKPCSGPITSPRASCASRSADLSQQSGPVLQRHNGIHFGIKPVNVIEIGRHDFDAGNLPRADGVGERNRIHHDDIRRMNRGRGRLRRGRNRCRCRTCQRQNIPTIQNGLVWITGWRGHGTPLLRCQDFAALVVHWRHTGSLSDQHPAAIEHQWGGPRAFP